MAATALYSTVPTESEEVLAGLGAYAAYDQTIVLTQFMLQQGTSPEAELFRRTLKDRRDGRITVAGWQSLVGRTKQRLLSIKWEFLRDALRLCGTHREVDFYNIQHLESLGRPVIKIKAVNTGKDAK